MKKTLALLLALAMCLSLCACGKKEEAPAMNPVIVMPSDMGASQNNGSGEENNSQFTAYIYDGEPTDLFTVEEVVLMPERFPMPVMNVSMSMNWKMKVVVFIVVTFLALLALAVGRNPYFRFLRFCVPQSLWPYYTNEPIHYNRIGSK